MNWEVCNAFLSYMTSSDSVVLVFKRYNVLVQCLSTTWANLHLGKKHHQTVMNYSITYVINKIKSCLWLWRILTFDFCLNILKAGFTTNCRASVEFAHTIFSLHNMVGIYLLRTSKLFLTADSSFALKSQQLIIWVVGLTYNMFSLAVGPWSTSRETTTITTLSRDNPLPPIYIVVYTCTPQSRI